MHDQGIGVDHVHDTQGIVTPEATCELCGTDIGQYRRIGRAATQGTVKTGVTATLFQSRALGTDGQGNAKMLCRLGQPLVDGRSPCGPAGHRTDQKRGFKAPTQEIDAQINHPVIYIRQRLMNEAPVVKPRTRRMAPTTRKHNIQVLVLAVKVD